MSRSWPNSRGAIPVLTRSHGVVHGRRGGRRGQVGRFRAFRRAFSADIRLAVAAAAGAVQPAEDSLVLAARLAALGRRLFRFARRFAFGDFTAALARFKQSQLREAEQLFLAARLADGFRFARRFFFDAAIARVMEQLLHRVAAVLGRAAGGRRSAATIGRQPSVQP